MIEREQHRADAPMFHMELAAHLKTEEVLLVERVAQTAIERGYLRYVPHLHDTIVDVVRGITDSIASFVASEHRVAFHPGESFERDPLAQFLHREAQSLRTSGVRAVVLFGLLQQCRTAFQSGCAEAPVGNLESCQALLDLCFDRLELSLVATWTSHSADASAFEAAPAADQGLTTPEHEIERRVAERTKELCAVNDHLRRELDQQLRVEVERESCYRSLLHRQKLEAVGSLAGGVAHDLNNLLQVVRCNIDLLRARADNVSFGMLEEISQVTDRAAGLVRQLLLFSRQQPLVRRTLDIGEIIRDLLRLLRRVMPESVRLFSEVEENLPCVRADLSAIEQLIVNLVINARDSMPQGGTVHVIVCRQRRVPPERSRAPSSMQQVAIYVRDVGIGMPEDVMARIFEPFFTTKYRGSGLGLSVVHGVVEEHGGWVEVTSTPDQGSCFAVFLPAMEDASLGEVNIDIGRQIETSGHGEHLLLVEDEEIVRRALARELSRQGYAVQAVASANEALAIYRRAPKHFDCVISDGLMPGMSGPEMVLEMLHENAEQRAIFISGFAPTMDCWPELQRRGCRLLAKPFGAKELVAVLSETLREEREEPALTLRTPEFDQRFP